MTTRREQMKMNSKRPERYSRDVTTQNLESNIKPTSIAMNENKPIIETAKIPINVISEEDIKHIDPKNNISLENKPIKPPVICETTIISEVVESQKQLITIKGIVKKANRLAPKAKMQLIREKIVIREAVSNDSGMYEFHPPVEHGFMYTVKCFCAGATKIKQQMIKDATTNEIFIDLEF